MAVRKIILMGDPRLKKICKPIKSIGSPKTKQLIRDMRDTMRKADLVGIAAPQIGENYQVFLTEPRKTKSRKNVANDKLRVYINPKYINRSKTEHVIWEGCGCTGDVYAPLKRSKTVTVEATDEKGRQFQVTADGLLGRILIHEMDHLQGVEFVQRVKDNSKFTHKDYYIKHFRNSKQNVENSKITKLEVREI